MWKIVGIVEFEGTKHLATIIGASAEYRRVRLVNVQTADAQEVRTYKGEDLYKQIMTNLKNAN